jgi:hypothetical protein
MIDPNPVLHRRPSDFRDEWREVCREDEAMKLGRSALRPGRTLRIVARYKGTHTRVQFLLGDPPNTMLAISCPNSQIEELVSSFDIPAGTPFKHGPSHGIWDGTRFSERPCPALSATDDVGRMAYRALLAFAGPRGLNVLGEVSSMRLSDVRAAVLAKRTT